MSGSRAMVAWSQAIRIVFGHSMLRAFLFATTVAAAPTTPSTPPTPAATTTTPPTTEDDDDWSDRPIFRRPLRAPLYLLPGASFVEWTPLHGQVHRGISGELSVVKWIPHSSFVLGGVARIERLERTRAIFGVELGYQMFGLELGVARDFARSGHTDAQTSLEIAPYVSIGVLYLSPRWILPLARSGSRAPGEGAMLTIGLKIPLLLARE